MTQEIADKLIAFACILGVLMLLGAAGLIWINTRRERRNVVLETPVTEEGLAQFDDLPAALAVGLCWSAPGDNPRWHLKMQEEVRATMPVLARNLDRLIEH